jgi:ornithine carbamoyltransferase
MKSQMAGRDFLTLMDFSKEEVEYFLDTAAELKRKRRVGEPHEYLKGKTVAMIFDKQSTRTRTSFQAAVAHLGGQSFYMRPDELQLARGEPIRDTASVIDRYCDGLFIRTSSQEAVEEFARYMENPVINACTNLTHPCQALADMLTIREKKGDFKGLKLAYAGDIWNVCQSLMVAGPMLGMNVYVAGPKGYEPNERILKFATAKAKETGTKLEVTHDLDEAVTGADVIYANTWHSMGAKDIEKRLKDFGPYQINEEVLAKAKDDVIFMHCGPAFHGEEMTDEVIYGSHSAVWDEAENRMHTEKAVLSLVIG